MIFFEKFEGRLPVEQQPPDRRMFRQQGVEIVRLFVGNGAVKASFPLAKLQAVPAGWPADRLSFPESRQIPPLDDIMRQ